MLNKKTWNKDTCKLHDVALLLIDGVTNVIFIFAIWLQTPPVAIKGFNRDTEIF